MFARRSPSKLVEAFARIFPVPFGILGYALNGYAVFLIQDLLELFSGKQISSAGAIMIQTCNYVALIYLLPL
jgi:hypothetical protein